MTTQEQYEMTIAWDDLVIAGQAVQLNKFLTEVDRLLPGDWTRNTSAEKVAVTRGFSLPKSHCYRRELTNREVSLWLYRVSDFRIQGGCVESNDLARYLPDSAEASLDFKNRVLEPAAKVCGLTLSRNNLGPLSLVPSGVKESLWAFYDSSQFQWPPAGEGLRRWRQFVASAYQERAAFNLDELKRWLVEKGWKTVDVGLLVEQLLADAALLEEYDDLHQPA